MASPRLRILVQTREATAAGTCREEELEQFPAVVGRGDDSQLVLADPSVAPAHMVFEYARGELSILAQKDCPVVCNQRPVSPDAPLTIVEGDEIRVGIFLLVFAGALPAPAQAPDGSRQARAMADRLLDEFARAPQWLLCIENGPSAGESLSLSEGSHARLGRASDCQLVMDDHQVSRVHARVGCSAGRVWLEDAGSANGVFVNGRPAVGRVFAPPGARITLGRISLALNQGPPRTSDLRAAFGAREGRADSRLWPALVVCLVIFLAAGVVAGGLS